MSASSKRQRTWRSVWPPGDDLPQHAVRHCTAALARRHRDARMTDRLAVELCVDVAIPRPRDARIGSVGTGRCLEPCRLQPSEHKLLLYRFPAVGPRAEVDVRDLENV